MNKESLLWVKISSSKYYKILMKLNEMNISLYEIKKYKNYIIIKISYGDYQIIKKKFYKYNVLIYDYVGREKIRLYLKKYIVFTVSIIVGTYLLLLINNITFKVDIKSPNKDIQKLLTQELEKNGLGKFKFKKNHNKIENIVNKILDDNKEELEWLEIKYDGLIMIVNVTPKTKEKDTSSYELCDIVSKTDAKIISLSIRRGIPLKDVNDYVSKGDVLISGSIIHNEELKNKVCADGLVFGEVWYKVSISMPLYKEVINYTGKKRYNLNILYNNNKYYIFRNRLKTKTDEEINIYRLNDFEINIVKEKEYKKEEVAISEKEAYEKARATALKRINEKLNKNEEIITQKVLKKEVNNSTIYLEIFIVTKESIGTMNVIEEVPRSDN